MWAQEYMLGDQTWAWPRLVQFRDQDVGSEVFVGGLNKGRTYLVQCSEWDMALVVFPGGLNKGRTHLSSEAGSKLSAEDWQSGEKCSHMKYEFSIFHMWNTFQICTHEREFSMIQKLRSKLTLKHQTAIFHVFPEYHIEFSVFLWWKSGWRFPYVK